MTTQDSESAITPGRLLNSWQDQSLTVCRSAPRPQAGESCVLCSNSLTNKKRHRLIQDSETPETHVPCTPASHSMQVASLTPTPHSPIVPPCFPLLPLCIYSPWPPFCNPQLLLLFQPFPAFQSMQRLNRQPCNIAQTAPYLYVHVLYWNMLFNFPTSCVARSPYHTSLVLERERRTPLF